MILDKLKNDYDIKSKSSSKNKPATTILLKDLISNLTTHLDSHSKTISDSIAQQSKIFKCDYSDTQKIRGSNF